jgi:predicted transcriptional regulator
MFDGHSLRTTDVQDLLQTAPDVGKAVVTLYQSYRTGARAAPGARERSGEMDTDGAAAEPPESIPTGVPFDEVADFIQDKGNYFAKLEAGAEALWRDAGFAAGSLERDLIAYLGSQCGVTVEIRPTDVMGGRLRVYEPGAMRLLLSEMLPSGGRTFQIAHQLAVLTQREVIQSIVAGGKFTTDDAEALARFALANYFAGAVTMPYGPFLAAARATRYDIEVLERRFDGSFEQVCHRLTELRRPGEQGVPLHFIRVDVAGNISKRFTASGIAIARFGGACPRWNVYDAFATPGMVRAQVSRMPNGETYFCIARTTHPAARVTAGRRGQGARRLAIGLGCAAAYARDMVYADGIDLDAESSIMPIGVSCRTCERDDCHDRAFPSLHHALAVDSNVRGVTPFGVRSVGKPMR